MIDRQTLYPGNTLRVSAQYLDDTGAPKSLTGTTVAAHVQILDVAKPCAIQITDLLTSQFDVYVAAAATADWPRGIWPLLVIYEWQEAGETQRQTEQLALIEVRSSS